MKRSRLSLVSCRSRIGALALCLAVAAGGALGQGTPPARGDYYEICRRLGFLPGTVPMRRCIDAQRSKDLDPLNALSDYDLTPPDGGGAPAPEDDTSGEFPGARQAEDLLKSTPEGLLLGPDYRARGQGIYE